LWCQQRVGVSGPRPAGWARLLPILPETVSDR
jgi:hypothetical protein